MARQLSSNHEASSVSSCSSAGEVEPSPNNARPSCFKSTVTECVFVMIATFAVAQNNVVAGSLRTQTASLAQDLQMNQAEITWTIAGQTMTSGTFLLFFGRVADLFGRKQQIVVGMGVFSILLLIAGFAQTPIMLNVFLGLSGVACAAVVPAAIGKLGTIYDRPSKRRNRAFSCFGAGAPVGVVMGSLIGGIASEVADWRASLWVLVVIYAFLTVSAYLVTPSDDDQQRHDLNLETLRKFDILGTLLCTAGLAALITALTEGSIASNGWRTPYVIVLLAVGVVLMACFAYWETICASPLIPRAPWKQRDFTLLLTILSLGFAGFNANIFWLTLLWQQVYQDSPLEVAIKFLPASIGGIIMCIVAAMIIHRINNRIISAVAACAVVASGALFSATGTTISYWALTFPGLVLSVVGQDLQFCVSNLYVVSSLPKEERSVGGGLLQMMSRLAVSALLGVETTIYASAVGGIEGESAMQYRPYQAAFWTSLGVTTIALAFVPFLRLGKQGQSKPPDTKACTPDCEK